MPRDRQQTDTHECELPKLDDRDDLLLLLSLLLLFTIQIQINQHEEEKETETDSQRKSLSY